MNKIVYLTQKGADRFNLPYGTPMQNKGTNDPYRVLGHLESFYQPVEGPETLIGMSPFKGLYTYDDPFSQKVAGPWTLDRKVEVSRDRLPEGHDYFVTSSLVDAEKYIGQIKICIDDRVEVSTDLCDKIVKDIKNEYARIVEDPRYVVEGVDLESLVIDF